MPGKWITADEVVHYLRQFEILEVVYSKLKSDNVPKDPENAPCTMAMVRKVAQSAQEAPSYNELSENKRGYALFTDGSVAENTGANPPALLQWGRTSLHR